MPRNVTEEATQMLEKAKLISRRHPPASGPVDRAQMHGATMEIPQLQQSPELA